MFDAERFRDRREAGRLLADALMEYAEQDAIVLGLARGGVPVAAEVAQKLGAPMDVIVARKLGAPSSPELAIGAVTSNGGRYIDEEARRYMGVSDDYIQSLSERERREARRREQRFRDGRWVDQAQGRTLIVIDDGLATGATMRAAVRSARLHGPSKVVVAVPVGAREACRELLGDADEVVCLRQPEPFYAVGLHYDEFEQTEDAEVQGLLREMARMHPVESHRTSQ